MSEYNFLSEHDKSIVGMIGVGSMIGASPVTTILCATTWLATRIRCIVVTGLVPVMFLIVIPDVIGTAHS